MFDELNDFKNKYLALMKFINDHRTQTGRILACKGGFTRQSHDSPAPVRSISLIEDGACRIFAGENFRGHRILITI